MLGKWWRLGGLVDMVAFTSVLGRAEGGAKLWSRVSLIGGVCFIVTELAAGAAWRRWLSVPTPQRRRDTDADVPRCQRLSEAQTGMGG